VGIDGGALTQVTFMGADFARVTAWSPDARTVFFTSSVRPGPLPSTSVPSKFQFTTPSKFYFATPYFSDD